MKFRFRYSMCVDYTTCLDRQKLLELLKPQNHLFSFIDKRVRTQKPSKFGRQLSNKATYFYTKVQDNFDHEEVEEGASYERTTILLTSKYLGVVQTFTIHSIGRHCRLGFKKILVIQFVFNLHEQNEQYEQILSWKNFIDHILRDSRWLIKGDLNFVEYATNISTFL